MTPTEFLEIIDTPKVCTQAQTNQLQKIVEEFPYFQTARALHLKGLKQNHHFSYNAELRKVAAYTADRRILFDYITSKNFNQHHISEEIKSRNYTEEITEVKNESFDEAVKMNLTEADRVLDPNLFEASKKDTTPSEKNNEEQLNLEKPLEFNKSEAHSFSEWLKLASAKKVNRPDYAPETNIKRKEISKKFELIDNFIANNPKISPARENKNKEIKLVDKGPSNQLMTETLARVYLEQKNYSKAIQAYKILILKNPEKSGLFADQIQEIKKLQENKSS
ncbi:hypothetical protein SAMN04488096_105321 [Mesonia phycicola]|uniref:Tetratricopeptide repeat-containing protein n=1 Tax=Mesonia phycicola TaxID=579105 RepID=A0A1M6EY00_9FLAO|nr:hypothetical protein [Mesonia phycicola]SHI90279.1 hypothetical protein SAMN04488096_105321 [Mesonia phycicola]